MKLSTLDSQLSASFERRGLPQATSRVELRAEGEKFFVEGYAAVFYREGDAGTEYVLWEGYVERILPGAFDRALREDDCRCLFNHDSDHILGRTKPGTLSLSVDQVGLKYRAELPDTQCGRDVRVSIERGDVDGSSFGFEALAQRRTETDERMIRELLECRLYDVGPVTFPAYKATTTEIARRSADEYRQQRDAAVKQGVARRRRLALFRRHQRVDGRAA